MRKSLFFWGVLGLTFGFFGRRFRDFAAEIVENSGG